MSPTMLCLQLLRLGKGALRKAGGLSEMHARAIGLFRRGHVPPLARPDET